MNLPLAFIGGLGHWELLVILIIALLIFGQRLPKVMRSLGQSVTEFKRGMNEVVHDDPNAPTAPQPPEPSNKDENATV